MNQGNNNDGAVAGSFNFSAQLPNGKSLTYSGYILAGEAMSMIDFKLDMAAAAVERQRLIAEVPELEAKLQQYIDARQSHADVLAEAISKLPNAKNKGETAQLEVSINTHRVNIAKIDREIARGQEALSKSRDLASKSLRPPVADTVEA